MELANDNATAPVGALAVTHVGVAPAQPLALPAGTRLGRYEMIRVLGRGGMGQVYLARDVVLGRRVAIKFMLDDRAARVTRFLEEARATARCQHENIVTIHEIGDHQGHGYMVLEYLEGDTLARTIAQGPHPAARAIELVLPVARALVHAHEQGVVHRDLKPDNVFVTTDGVVKVLDFGIAAALGAGPGREVSEGTHSVLGTPLYMAPEQHLGRAADGAADQWAFGVLFHQLLVGHHPLGNPPPSGSLVQVIDLDRPMPPCPTDVVPAEVAAVIDRCLRKRPEDRFPSTRALHAALEAIQPAHRTRGDRRPFPGLAAFTAADADVYFGRAADVRRALGRLREQPLLAVVGPSGVGKSSFVKAGLGRALADEEPWEILATRPGHAPLASLAELVSAAGGDPDRDADFERLRAEPGYLASLLRARAGQHRRKLLVFVDQLEELFTHDVATEDRAAYVACIAAIADDLAAPLRLVLAMRSDFLDRVAEHGELMAPMSRALLFLSPLDRAGLREALVEPVRRAGYHFEADAVVDDVLDAIEHAPAALSLLQFVAERMWDARDPAARRLSADAYRGIGGVGGAIAAHADRVIAELPPARQRAARALLLRLVTPERTRAVVELREAVEAIRDAGDVIDALVAARLLVVSGEGAARTLEIVHDALITGWPALAGWLAEEHEVVTFVAAVRAATARWEERGRPASALWRGDELAHARRLCARMTDRLAEREQRFVDVSAAAEAREHRRRRWLWATAVIVLAVVATTATVAALWIRRAEGTARISAERARDRANEALAAREAAAAAAERAQAAERARGAERDRRRAAEERAGAAATEVERSNQDLATANARLSAALEEERQASAQAQAARAAALTEAARAQRAEQAEREKQVALEALLRERDQRLRKLEQQLKKISTELR